MSTDSWPDLEAWAVELKAELAERDASYQTAPDMEVKRAMAARILACVVSALHRLPPIQQAGLHLPLKDLLIFLSDLERGRAHAWSRPTNFGGTNSTTTADGELHLWVKGVAGVLKSVGMSDTESFKLIALALTETGRTGRKRSSIVGEGVGPVAWQSVRRWARADVGPVKQPIVNRVTDWWQTMKIDHRDNIQRLGERQVAELFAREVFKLPHHRDTIHFEHKG